MDRGMSICGVKGRDIGGGRELVEKWEDHQVAAVVIVVNELGGAICVSRVKRCGVVDIKVHATLKFVSEVNSSVELLEGEVKDESLKVWLVG